ncbi:MAG TPA: DUF4145 domain-containing protein [Methylomirabilota bacterium]|nr:DUF4145 domain-containing protein [Methylomirabilota bacterium]
MFQHTAFNCPYCDVYAHQIWSGVVRFTSEGLEIDFEDVSVSVCQRCKHRAIWVNKNLIYPESNTAPLPNPDMPQDIQDDYYEAASISAKSPRGATALLRLAIQKLCVHLGQTGKDLNSDIANLVKDGLPVQIQKALDIVRVIGNNAVHPGVIDLKDDQETVNTLFNLINHIVQNRITQPKEIDALYETLPEEARTAIDKRDTPKS